MRKVYIIFVVLGGLLGLGSSNQALASCEALRAIANMNQAADALVEQVWSVEAWRAENSEANKIKGPVDKVLDELETKRILQPHPAAVQMWFTDYLSQALRADFTGSRASQKTPFGGEAAELIWGHPDLMALFVQKAMGLDHKVSLRMFYGNFINLVVHEMQGGSSNIRNELWDNAKLSLYELTPINGSNIRRTVDKILNQTGVRGFVISSTQPDSFIAAMNADFLHNAMNGSFKLDKIEFDNASPSALMAIAAAKRVHILSYLSDRWFYPALTPDRAFLDTVYAGTEQIPRKITLYFYSKEAAKSWEPPAEVEVNSRIGAMVTITIYRASKMLRLDGDLRVRKFCF